MVGILLSTPNTLRSLSSLLLHSSEAFALLLQFPLLLVVMLLLDDDNETGTEETETAAAAAAASFPRPLLSAEEEGELEVPSLPSLSLSEARRLQ